MRILELNIKNIRGIKQIDLLPDGKNIVIFGPNGTGKSAIVDSVDFLLSGKINRLTGKGTKSLSIKEHGCHVDFRDNLRDTVVTAKVKVDGNEIILERSISKPTQLKITPKKFEKSVDAHLRVANLGQHILSRREILRFITAEEGERAKEIMELLDLSDIDSLRAMLVKIENEADNEYKNKKSNFEVAKNEIKTLLSLPAFSEEECLKKVNELRKTLGGVGLKELDTDKIKEGLTPYLFEAKREFLTKEQIENYIKDTKSIIDKNKELSEKETKLKALLEAIQKETKLKQYSLYKKLYETGISLTTDKNICPLCGRKWTDGSFKKFLEAKRKETDVAKEKQEEIDKLSALIKTQFDLLQNDIVNLDKAKRQFGMESKKEDVVKKITEEVKEWSDVMLEPLEKWENNKWPKKSITQILDATSYDKQYFTPLKEALAKSGDQLTKQQNTWEILIRLVDKWKTYKQNLKNKQVAEIYKRRAQASREYFEKARDLVLTDIYNAVKGGFDKYYTTIHSEDEDSFSSELKPDGPYLKLEVDFYKRGKFPPHALHSEGHQDSMGLCLFLALNEHLTKGVISVIVLDDVVMSIDRTHRKDICKLLKDSFPDKQFIITTHDTAWAKQLQSEGIVSKRNMVHFLNWNIDVGPIFRLEKDLWERIDEDLNNDDVSSAAHKLRRNAECFFEDVCDLFIAKVPYKGNHQWELEDFAASAISAYKDYLKKAKENFNKLNQQKKVKELGELEKHANEVIQKSKVERWVVNANVHYNKWSEYSKNDFKDVVAVFRDLFALFSCPDCGQTISITEKKGDAPKAVLSCECQTISWNVT